MGGGALGALGLLTIEMLGVRFLNNTSEIKGGACSFDLSSTILPLISNCVFENNSATFKGGAISIQSPILNKINTSQLYNEYFSPSKRNIFSKNSLLNDTSFGPNISSFSYKKKITIYDEYSGMQKFSANFEGKQESKAKKPIQLYSGEKINIVIELFDHLNQITTDFHKSTISCNVIPHPTLQTFTFIEENIAKEIELNKLNLTSFSISSTYLGDKLNLSCSYSRNDKDSIYDTNTDLTFPALAIELIACKRGQVFQQSKCKLCENSFSFADRPDSFSICQPCPRNAKCIGGKHIFP